MAQRQPGAGRHAGPRHGSAHRAELAARAVTLPAALLRPSDEVMTFVLGIAVARGPRARADHKFLIGPQCTPSAGISLCGICAKSEQLLAILLVFTELPQLRHIAVVNAPGARVTTSRTGTARS